MAHILVVEDDENIVRLLQIRLESVFKNYAYYDDDQANGAFF